MTTMSLHTNFRMSFVEESIFDSFRCVYSYIYTPLPKKKEKEKEFGSEKAYE